MPTKYDTKNKKQGSWEKRVKEIYSKGKRRREEKKDTKSRMKKKKRAVSHFGAVCIPQSPAWAGMYNGLQLEEIEGRKSIKEGPKRRVRKEYECESWGTFENSAWQAGVLSRSRRSSRRRSWLLLLLLLGGASLLPSRGRIVIIIIRRINLPLLVDRITKRINVRTELDNLAQEIRRLALPVGHRLCRIGVTR